MKSISGNGCSLIPFKGKHEAADFVLYNVIIQKLIKDDELIVTIIKNGVPVDGAQTKQPLGSVSLIGEC